MADKMKVSKECDVILNRLNSRLGVKNYILCRLAIAVSLSNDVGKLETDPDNTGSEFNKSTIMGTDEYIFLAMMAVQKSESIDVNESFSTIVRDHVIRGLKIMNKMYDEINSPIEFLKKLCD